jgi:hypothetical protein
MTLLLTYVGMREGRRGEGRVRGLPREREREREREDEFVWGKIERERGRERDRMSVWGGRFVCVCMVQRVNWAE